MNIISMHEYSANHIAVLSTFTSFGLEKQNKQFTLEQHFL